MRVGQQRAQGRRQEIGRFVDADVARGEHAADDFRHAEALGDGEAGAVFGGAPEPGALRQAVGHR
jgi:hypothetical protein